MKFYFCEGCGARITEEDIHQGAGLNKKLKGVYCRNCGIGVTTMDTLPMDDEEARKLTEQEAQQNKPSSDSATIKRRKRRTSARAQLEGQQRKDSDSKARVAPASPPIAGALVGIGAGLVVFLLAGLFLLGGDKGDETSRPEQPKPPPAKGSPAREGTREDFAKADPGKELANSEQSEVDVGTVGKQVTKNSQPVPNTDSEVDEQARQQSPSTPGQDDAGQTNAPVEKVEPKTPDVDPARKAAELQRQKEQALEAARTRLTKTLLAFEETARIKEWSGVARIAREAQQDEGLSLLKAEIQMLVEVADVFTEHDVERKKRIKALLDGKLRTILTRRKKLRAVIKGVDQDGLDLSIHGTINGQPIQYGKHVKFTELSEKGNAELFGTFTPNKAPEWIAQSVRMMTSSDFDGAEKALASAGDTPLTAHFKGRLATLRREAREAAAVKAWDGLKKLHEAKRWKALLLAIEGFKETHATSTVGRQNKEALRQLFDHADREVALAEGLGFNFASTENVERFKRVFSQRKPYLLSISFDNGKLKTKRIKKEMWATARHRFRAPGVILGDQWDLSYRIDTGMDEKEVYSHKINTHSSVWMKILFTSPTSSADNVESNAHRLSFLLNTSWHGTLLMRFMGKADDPKKQNVSGVFAGIKGKLRNKRWAAKPDGFAPPGSADGVYRVKISMRGSVVKARINNVPALDVVLPPAAIEVVKNSCLGFSICARGVFARHVSLEEFTFSKRDKKRK